MRNLKRALSLTLASVMLLGMMVVGTSAASFPDVESSDNVEAIEVAKAVGVMIGDDRGNFNPDAAVTRNEMAVIMAKLMLGTYEADSYVGTHPFTDVPEWADRYVAACYASGIVAGRSATIYDGTATVTAVEAAAMMLRALGYEDLSKNADRWDQPVAAKANEISLFEGMSGNGGANMDRNSVAKLTLNTLKATMVTTTRSGQDITLPDGTVIASARNYNERGTAMYDYTQSDGQYTSGGDNKLQLCEYLYGRDLTLTAGVDDLGRTTDLWQYKGDDVTETAKEAWKVMVINPDDSANISSVLTSDDYFDLSASSIDAGVTYKLNGDDAASGTSLQAGDVVELFRADNKVTKVIVARYQLAKVSKVDDDVSTADAKDGAAYYVSLKGMNGTSMGTYNDNDFAGFNAAEYTEDTFIAIAQNGDSEIVDSHVAKVVEGKVNAYKSPKTITLGGTKYSLAASLATGSISSFDFDDTQYVIYMTEQDYVLGIDGAEAVQLDDVYYVHSAYFTRSGNGNTNYYAQVVDMDGVESEIQIEESTFKNTFTGMDTTNANKFNPVQGLYTFTDKDAATKGFTATTGDCSGHSNDRDSAGTGSGSATHWHNANGDQIAFVAAPNTTAEAKSNNGKMSAKDYVTNADYGVASNRGGLDTLDGEINSSSKSVTVDNGQFNDVGAAVRSAYIDSATKFILIDNDGSDADLDISTSTGSAKVGDGKQAFVIASKDGSSYVAKVVIVVDDDVSAGVSSDEVLYLTETSTTKVKDGYEATAYFMDGTSKTVTIDDDGDEGFFTYSINKDGVYELGSAPGPVSVTGTNYDDEPGVIADNVIVSIYNSRLITFTTAKLKDIALSDDLQVVDARPGSVRDNSAYTQKITDLSKLEAAMDRDDVTATAYVDDGEVLLISVTDMADARSTDADLGTVTATKTVANITAVNATVSGTKIIVTVEGTPNNGDKITVTATANHNKATVTGSPVTLTYNGTSTVWEPSGDITVTAERGNSTTYTVQGPLPAGIDPTITAQAAPFGLKSGADSNNTVTATVSNASDIGSDGGTLTYVWQDITDASNPDDLDPDDPDHPETVNVEELSVGVHTLKCTVTNAQDGKADATASAEFTVVVFPKDWDAVVTGTWKDLTVAANGDQTYASGFSIVDTLDSAFAATAAKGDGTALETTASIESDGSIKVQAKAADSGAITVTLTYSYTDSSNNPATLTEDYTSGSLTVAAS